MPDLKAAIARAKAAKKPPTAPKSPSAGKFEEAKHPRGQGGKFRPDGGRERKRAQRPGRKEDGPKSDRLARRAAELRHREKRKASEAEAKPADSRLAEAARRAKELAKERLPKYEEAKPAASEGKMQAARDRYEAGINAGRKQGADGKPAGDSADARKERMGDLLAKIRASTSARPASEPEPPKPAAERAPATRVLADLSRAKKDEAVVDRRAALVEKLAVRSRKHKEAAARAKREARKLEAQGKREEAADKLGTALARTERSTLLLNRAVALRDARYQESKPTTKPERPAERGAGFIGEIPAKDVHFDPARFQYKLATTDSHTGSVGSLAGVKKWDKELAGVVGVWKDPANGKTFVVNGHNRLDLANKLGVDKVAVRYLDAPTAEMARAKGALANIAEGRGTSVDAAKFFRDSGIKDVQSLQDRGIPLAEGKTREGLALAGLANPLFRRVIDGTLPIDKAALIGGGGLSDSQQMQLGKLLDKQKGRATSSQVREWVDEAKAAGERKRDSGPGLFGDDGSDDEALFLHRTALNAHVAERLSREKKLFGTVARKRSADELSRGGNVIDSEASGKISRDASEALAVFSQLKRTSVFAGATQAATLRMADAKNDRERAQIRDEYYTEVKKRVRDAYNLGK